jgi:hypothetical protein
MTGWESFFVAQVGASAGSRPRLRRRLHQPGQDSQVCRAARSRDGGARGPDPPHDRAAAHRVGPSLRLLDDAHPGRSPGPDSRGAPERGHGALGGARARLSLAAPPPHRARRSGRGHDHVAPRRPHRTGPGAGGHRLPGRVRRAPAAGARCGCAVASRRGDPPPAPTASGRSSGRWSGAAGAGTTRRANTSGRASSSPSWSSLRWPLRIVRCSWCSITPVSTQRAVEAWLGEHSRVQLLSLPA